MIRLTNTVGLIGLNLRLSGSRYHMLQIKRKLHLQHQITNTKTCMNLEINNIFKLMAYTTKQQKKNQRHRRSLLTLTF